MLKRLYEGVNGTGTLEREVLCVRGGMKLCDRRHGVRGVDSVYVTG